MAYDLVARLRLIDNASDPLRRFQHQLKTTASIGASTFSGITSSVTKLAGAIGLASAAWKTYQFAANSVGKAMDFEAQMSSIQALTGATNSEMRQMTALALKMGAQTKYSALEAAKGIEELLKAGLTPAQVQAQGLEAALNLATAGELELADAAEIMSTAMNAFKRDGLSAAQASNILAGTANASATSVQELRMSLAQASAVASGVGMSFEDTNTALGLFANNGLKGSDAGTSLKTMLSNLQPTTKQQIALFKKLGIMTASGANEFFDMNGQLKDLDDIAGILRKSLGKMTDQQRMLALETMFGSDAIRAGTILYKEGAEGVAKFREEMAKVTALEVAKKKMDNARGAVEQFKGAVETLQISALTPLMPVIKNLALAAADLVEKYGPAITAAVTDAVSTAQNYLNSHFFNNPEFQKLPDLKSKIGFVWDDLMKTFNDYMQRKGNAQLRQLTANMITGLSQLLIEMSPQLAQVALTIGKNIGVSMAKGMFDAIGELPLFKYDITKVAGSFISGKILDYVFPENTQTQTPAVPSPGVSYDKATPKPVIYGPPMPAKAANTTVNVNMHGVTIREKADAQLIAKEIAREINRGGR